MSGSFINYVKWVKTTKSCQLVYEWALILCPVTTGKSIFHAAILTYFKFLSIKRIFYFMFGRREEIWWHIPLEKWMGLLRFKSTAKFCLK